MWGARWWLLCVSLALVWTTSHMLEGKVAPFLLPRCVCIPRALLLATFGDHDCSSILKRNPFRCPESDMCC